MIYGDGWALQVPVRPTVLVPALVDATDKVPVRLVLPVGVKVTAMLQPAPTASEAGQVFTRLNQVWPAVMLDDSPVTAAVPVFVAETAVVTGPP